MITHQDEDEHHGGGDNRDGERQCGTPTIGFRQRGKQRQEDELAGGVARGHQADDEAAALRKPARGNGCAEHQRRHARADTDDDAPEQEELPDLGHEERGDDAAHDERQRRAHHLANAEMIHEGSGKRAKQAEKHETNRHGGGDVGDIPAEFLMQRLDHHASRAHGAGRCQHGQEGGGSNHPAVVQVSTGHPPGDVCGDHVRRPFLGAASDGFCGYMPILNHKKLRAQREARASARYRQAQAALRYPPARHPRAARPRGARPAPPRSPSVLPRAGPCRAE